MLVFAVGLLQRWVLRPLARLAAGAERIAGGELAIAPVATRAREVAQVGDAMQWHGRRARTRARHRRRPPNASGASC